MSKQHRDRLSDEERIARRKASKAKWQAANREKHTAITMAARAKNLAKHQAAQKLYREANAERIKAQQLEYRAANRDWINAGTRGWQLANPEAYASYQREYRQKNSDKWRAKSVKWRAENPERCQEHSRAWAEANPEARRLMQHKRRAAKQSGGGVVSPDIYKRLRAAQRGLCVVCRATLSKVGEHLDHVMPLALGGAHADANLQLLCPPCNLSKNAKHPVDFMQQRGFLL